MSSQFEKRTVDSHNYHISLLNGSAFQHMGTCNGLVRNSILNHLQYFHVTSGLSPDIMHDLLEGLLQYELKQLIQHLINEKVVSLTHINEAIQFFPYGYTDIKNKPCVISTAVMSSNDHTLKQNGKPLLLKYCE